MKYFLSIISLAFFVTCKDLSKGKVETNTLKPFDLSTLPNDWVKLTETDSGLIVFNSCDMGNLLLTINNNCKNLLLHGTQEDDEFTILNSFQIVNDTILIKTKLKNSEEFQDFKFVWENKSKMLGRWITTYSSAYTSDLKFISSSRQNEYLKFNQPCRECWGDECDEKVKDTKNK